MFDETPQMYTTFSTVPGPFESLQILTNDPEEYVTYHSKFAFTPEDMKCDAKGVGYVESYIQKRNNSYSVRENASNGGAFGAPFDEATIYVCYPDKFEKNVYGRVWATQTTSQWDRENFIGQKKVSGSFTKDANGNEVLVRAQINKDSEGNFTFLSPVDQFNITTEGRDIVNFDKTLFASARIMAQANEDKTVLQWMDLSMVPTGPYHEYVSLDDCYLFIHSLKYNGVETPLELIEGSPCKDATYEATFIYDNVMVEGTYQCEAEVTLGFTCATDDTTTPMMTNYQVALEDGTIVSRIPTDKKGLLYVSAQDSGGIDTIEISVAPNNSEDFKPLTAEVTKNANMYGAWAVADLSGLAHDVFYTVKVLIKDESGNYSENTLYYCFNITDEENTGIKGIATSQNNNVEYYNLQGLRIANPENGNIYIVKRGNDVHKELYTK